MPHVVLGHHVNNITKFQAVDVILYFLLMKNHQRNMVCISGKKGYNRSLHIFSFPPAAASFIFQQFSQYGNIQKQVIATDGNWMHVHYQSILQAKKALCKNGKVFWRYHYGGVTPCID